MQRNTLVQYLWLQSVSWYLVNTHINRFSPVILLAQPAEIKMTMKAKFWQKAVTKTYVPKTVKNIKASAELTNVIYHISFFFLDRCT